jgi:hypothetical protein
MNRKATGDRSMKMHSSLSSSDPPMPSSSAVKKPLTARSAADVVKNLQSQRGWSKRASGVACSSLLAAHVEADATWQHEGLGHVGLLLLNLEDGLRVANALQHGCEARPLPSTARSSKDIGIGWSSAARLTTVSFEADTFALAPLCAVGVSAAFNITHSPSAWSTSTSVEPLSSTVFARLADGREKEIGGAFHFSALTV